MKREIKFRAWYHDIGYGMSQPFTFGEYPTWDGKTLSHWSGRATIEQFTGLHDKHGKEVYEGDVCDGYGCIEFRNGAFHVVNKKGQTVDYLCHFNMDRFEIIGNIHEEKNNET